MSGVKCPGLYVMCQVSGVLRPCSCTLHPMIPILMFCMLRLLSYVLSLACCVLRPVSSVLCPMSGVLCPVSCVSHPKSGVVCPLCCVQCRFPMFYVSYPAPASYIRCPASCMRLYPLSFPLFCVVRPVSCAPCSIFGFSSRQLIQAPPCSPQLIPTHISQNSSPQLVPAHPNSPRAVPGRPDSSQ